MGLGHQRVGVGGFLGLEVVELDELGAVDGQFQVEDVVVAGVEGHAAGLGVVEVGVHAQHHLLVQHQHLGLVLGDVGLQFAADLAGEVAHHLVHQLAHHVADFIRRVRRHQVFLGHAHAQQVALVQLHRGGGREIDDDQAREAAIEQHKAANVGLEAGFGDALHHAGIVHLALCGHGEHARDGVAQAHQQVFGAEYDGLIREAHDGDVRCVDREQCPLA